MMTDSSHTRVSPRESLRQSIDAYQLSQCVYVAAKLGLADLLKEGPRSSEELAQASGAHPQTLFRLLRALTSAGVFARLPDGRFALDEVSEYLCQDAPGSLRAWAILAGEQPYPAWSQLLYSVQTGEPAFDHLHGISNWQYRAEHPMAAQVFNKAMSEVVRASTAAIVTAYDFSQFARIVDVGGGQGDLLVSLLKANPSLHGVLFDLEPVIASAKESLREARISVRCEAIAGSFIEGVPRSGDAYILKDVIMDWDDSEATRILRNCREAMQENGTLLIVERIIASDQPTLEASMVDLRMLVMVGGRARTREEFQALFSGAGFELTKVIPTSSPYQFVEGKAV